MIFPKLQRSLLLLLPLICGIGLSDLNAQNNKNSSSSKASSSAKSSASKSKTNPSQNVKPKTSPTPPTTKEKAAPTSPPTESAKPKEKTAIVSTISSSEIKDYDTYSPKLQALIKQALALTKQNLTYRYGSSDPKSGGMDCSGTMYYLLRTHGGYKNVPRQSDQICEWSMKTTILYRTENTHDFKASELKALKPGDLLYWSGTYTPTEKRDLPITHVMLYLGIHKETGKPLVFGASDGRVYQGKSQNGVSIFDFSLPKADSKAQFYGYASLKDIKD